MRARVFVTLKPSVFDPQGTTVADALHSLGYAAVKDVRQGKYFELEIEPARRRARPLATEAADKLLANPVIESYRIESGSRTQWRPADEIRRRCVSRIQLRPRCLSRREARARPGG